MVKLVIRVVYVSKTTSPSRHINQLHFLFYAAYQITVRWVPFRACRVLIISFIYIYCRLREFWWAFQEVWLRLYGLGVASGAAVSGHAPAGGAVLAACCDYRSMVKSDKFTIGLNENQFGLLPPFWVMDTFENTVGHREAEFGLLTGRLYRVDEALKIRLIDEVVPDKANAIGNCMKIMEEMNLCVPQARHMAKMNRRASVMEKLKSQRNEDVDAVVKGIMKDEFQKVLGGYIASLSKPKK